MKNHMWRRVRVSLLAIGAVPAAAVGVRAQGSVPFGGSLLRYSADTVWQETDSTSMRSVYHGDTVSLRRTVNDRVIWEREYVVIGAVSRLVTTRDTAGARATAVGQLVPTMVPLMARTLLETSLREASLAARAATLGLTVRGPGMAAVGAPPTVYPVSAAITIVQHGDTARYLRRHADATDTTVYVFRGSDSVARLSPAPVRTFGPGMVASLLGQMRTPANRVTAASITPAFVPSATPATAFMVGGGLMRSHGDTVWEEHDSSATVSVFRGDTVTTRSFVNDAEQRTVVELMVAGGDSAKILMDHEAAGAPTSFVRGTVPRFAASDPRAMFQRAMLDQDRRINRPAGTEPPVTVAIPTTYSVSAGVKIVQHRDTALYIRGCAPLSPVDTTVFVFFGADSVRRVTPGPPRRFGPQMTSVLVGDMRMSLVLADLLAHDPVSDAKLPPLPRCAR